jgi:hypothetical protein
MSWQDPLNGDSLTWLLEPENMNVRYLALRDLLDRPADDPELQVAYTAAYQDGPIADVLEAIQPDGYWVKPGPGYNPKYRSTVWALSLLGQLGARAEDDERIARACMYFLEHNYSAGGFFSVSGTPGGTVDCLQGNMCAALTDLGLEDERLEAAFEWMARSVTGEGVAPKEDRKAPMRYYAYKCGPDFLCGANYQLACGWGAVKVMLAFSKLPAHQRTALIERAIEAGEKFLLSVDPAEADYPTHENKKPNRSWWKFGFPVFYVTDVLQNVEALARLGYGQDPRLENAIDLILSKQDADGRWPLEYSYAGKTWVDIGEKGQPNKWVTLRALKVLKQAENGQTK